MQKRKLYLDCDGVILDTIKKSYEIIENENLTTEDEKHIFYKNINWEELIIISGEIDHSISKIKTLSNYFDIEILTHVNSENETKAKITYFSKELPGINVIPVFKSIDKCDAVHPNGAILVDDFIDNLEKWKQKGGISIKFSDSGKNCGFITITDLLQLLDIDFENAVRKVKGK